MKVATHQDILKLLGLDHVKNVRSCTISMTGGSLIPEVVLSVLIEKQETDLLSVINSGKSHAEVLAIVKDAETPAKVYAMLGVAE